MRLSGCAPINDTVLPPRAMNLRAFFPCAHFRNSTALEQARGRSVQFKALDVSFQERRNLGTPWSASRAAPKQSRTVFRLAETIVTSRRSSASILRLAQEAYWRVPTVPTSQLVTAPVTIS